MMAAVELTGVVVVAAGEVLAAAEEVALDLVLFALGDFDSVEEDLDSEVGSSDSVKENPDFAAAKMVLVVNVDPEVQFDFVMGVLPVEFQALEVVGLAAVEDLVLVKEGPDLVMEVPGSELVVPDPEQVVPALAVEVLALVKEDPDYVRDLEVAEADLVAKADLDVAKDVPELEQEGPVAWAVLGFELAALVAVLGHAIPVELVEILAVQMPGNWQVLAQNSAHTTTKKMHNIIQNRKIPRSSLFHETD